MHLKSPGLVVAFVVLAVTAMIGATSARSQNAEHMALLKNLDQYTTYNDIWGYAANGVELAILGTITGTSFVNATDPVNAYEVAFIDGVDSFWRDIKTYQTYAYIVNEDGGGLQIVDLSNPLNPILVNSYTAAFATAHNLWIDETTGLLYAVGVGNDTKILDLTADPVHPTIAHTFSNFYVHDMYTRDGVGYLAAVYGGYLATADISQLPAAMPVLDTITTDNAFTHNVWLTQDGNYALTTDETGSGHITVVDASNPGNLQRVGSYVHPDNPDAIIHNVLIDGDFAFVSWYTNGVEVIDVSNPLDPQRAGYYDTYAGSSSSFDGAWGVYPFAPSGTIYASDISNGLFLLSFDGGTVDVPAGNGVPAVTQLLTVSPNPFRAGTQLRFELAERERLAIDVFDVHGRLVRRLVEGTLDAGPHAVTWDGRDVSGRVTTPGVYLVKLESAGTMETMKVVRAD